MVGQGGMGSARLEGEELLLKVSDGVSSTSTTITSDTFGFDDRRSGLRLEG